MRAFLKDVSSLRGVLYFIRKRLLGRRNDYLFGEVCITRNWVLSIAVLLCGFFLGGGALEFVHVYNTC